jgi:hypothetical protein
MSDTNYQADEQDQSEVFDEDNFDAVDAGGPTNDFKTLEELPDVLDVTSAVGDGDEEDFDEDDLDLDDTLAADGVEPEADELYGTESPRLTEIDSESDGLAGEDEVELVYVGLMEDVKGAQSSAAHWEAKRLSDDDIADLGYGPDAEEGAPR